MKAFNLFALSVMLLCSLSSYLVGGDLLRRHHLKDQPETGISQALDEGLMKTIDKEKIVYTNSGIDDSDWAPKTLVFEAHEIQVKNNLHKEDEDPVTGGHLDVPNEGHLTITTRNDFPCPEAAAISPCVCSYDTNFNIDLDCTEVESEEQLAHVFMQEFPVKELRLFHMTKNDKLKVIGNILNGITFQEIQFNPGPFIFEIISEYFLLTNKDTLIKLGIWDSQVTSDSFPFAILGELKKCYFLHIHKNLLTWIPKIRAPKLTHIDFDQGLITTVETGTFPVRADKLSLALDYNAISVIEPGSFYFTDENSTASNEYLQLYLNTNQLQSLEAGLFQVRDAPMLFWFQVNQISSIEPGTFVLPATTDHFSVEFNFADNLLTTIDEEAFGELLPFVTTFTVYGNPLQCGCDIAWLVLNPDNMAKIDTEATCNDGTNLHLLDPALYESVC